ncbi:MAG TPA: Gmad2 immunoglobulin-like domain-containing protein [Nocardioidaceae bacterium]|nr:Gmad2 immunoglobulin-like domain-containing protein [Nocardioidaceae bacterium]
MKPTDDQVRGLLDDAVADVEPRRGLDDIRARTATARRRPRVWGVSAAAVLATAAAVLGVVVLGPGMVGQPGPDPGPAAGPVTGPNQAREVAPTVLVYFVGSAGGGPRLFPEPRVATSKSAALDEAVAAAVSGTAADADYRSLWPTGTTMERAQLNAGVLSVDLSGPVTERPPGLSQPGAALALQQLVLTAQGVTGSRVPVTFLVGGRPAATVLGEPTSRPVAAAATEDIVTPVSVSVPTEGSTVTSPFTVEGSASAFEANVQWELVRDGAVVKRGFATAAECCTLSPYSFRVTAPPGDYTLVVHDEDVSGGEGSGPTRDTKRFLVR